MTRPPRGPSLSLSGKLSLVFFAIPLLAIAAIYLYVAPGLQTRLIDSKLSELRTTAAARTAALRASVGSSMPLHEVRRLVMSISESTSNRVMLLSVNEVGGRPQLVTQMDSAASGTGSGTVDELSSADGALALRAVRTRSIATGTVWHGRSEVAEAVDPVLLGSQPRRVAAVIVFTAPIADVLRTVTTVRREILVAGGLALLLALLAGMAVARALARRVRRLEQAAQQLAAGKFGDPIPVDSADELGQLAAAFNEMQSQLLALESARKRFIATASHELRTPIFSVGGFLELLEDEDLDVETRRRFLDQIRDQVRRLGKLSVDLLDLSRLEAGSLDLRPEEVDLGELVRSVAREFEPTLALRDAHVEVRLAGESDATCDPVRVAQVV
jgi:signal transduction histidine kinase